MLRTLPGCQPVGHGFIASGSLSEAIVPAVLQVGKFVTIPRDTTILPGMKRDLLASKKVRISHGCPVRKYQTLMPILLGRNLERAGCGFKPGPTFLCKIIEKPPGWRVTQKIFFATYRLNGGRCRFGHELIVTGGMERRFLICLIPAGQKSDGYHPLFHDGFFLRCSRLLKFAQ